MSDRPDLDRTYMQREDSARDAVADLQTYAALILRDLDEGRLPELRGILDAALKLTRDVEVMTVLASIEKRQDR